MTPRELLNAGHLGQAIQELTQQVKARPTDTSLRVFLFELLSFEGAWDRADKQLDVIATQADGAVAELAVQVYRDLIAAERVRRAVFHGDALPKFLLSPPSYIDQSVLLVKKMVAAPKEAVALLPAAEELYPALAGRFGDSLFSTFRDADDRLAPVLEVFHGADYVWLPLEQIGRLQVSEPKSLRDLLWARAKVETYEQSVGDVFVPALYVDTHTHADDQVRLGRMTNWQAIEDQLVCGAGQRVFLVDHEERSLLELRDVQFDRVGDKAVPV
jgi:type VI secretion system protein ImpE